MSPDRSRVSAPIRILVVDDHPAVREGLSLLVSSEGMNVCAEAGRRDEALALAAERRPNLAVVDISLDGENGLLLVAGLKVRGVPVLVYSMHGDAEHVEDAFNAGALGYVTKSEFRGVLVEAIREVAAGHRFLSPKAGLALADRLHGLQPDSTLKRLSEKEQQVYRLIGRGDGTQEIAAAMHLSTHTVESYFTRIRLKFGLDGMHELRHHAIEHFRRQGG